MDETSPVIWWVRRDLRLSDNPALAAAAAGGRRVIPVFLRDESVAGLGAAPLWRLGAGLAAFDRALREIGSRLILRSGPALPALERLIAETGAGAVHWGRLYDPTSRARDSTVKSALRERGLEARSFPGFLLHEPWEVTTGQGDYYKVYTPFWTAVKARPLPPGPGAVRQLAAPLDWPESERLEDWHLGAATRRGAEVVARYAVVGEAAAADRLARFTAERIGAYREARDFPAGAATSGLSENLALGEIGPRTVWHAGMRALHEEAAGAEHFLKELVWREFAWALMYHTPHIATRNWRAGWEDFPWRGDNEDAERWRRGMTGEPMVDAAMREMYVTGTMHNRARMIAASYLTKHLLTDWRVGQRWFAECLTDWDAASNAMGWQWVAGSGPDAAPYFRVFNPATQAAKFDPEGTYRRRFLAEMSANPGPEALDFYRAVPRSWGYSRETGYPEPLIALDAGRARALAALAQRKA